MRCGLQFVGSCGSVCGRSLSCGKHTCPVICHEGDHFDILLTLVSTHAPPFRLQGNALLVKWRSRYAVCVVGQSGRRGVEIGNPGQMPHHSLAILSVEGKCSVTVTVCVSVLHGWQMNKLCGEPRGSMKCSSCFLFLYPYRLKIDYSQKKLCKTF